MSRSDVEALSRQVRPSAAVAFPFPVFDGYPYLVTRLLANVHNYLLVPAELAAGALRDLARRQVRANRLPTALALDESFCLYLGPDGREYLAPPLAGGGRAVDRALRLTVPISPSRDLTQRSEQLDVFVSAQPDDPLAWEFAAGGRPAPQEDRGWLAERGADGAPHGLVRCLACGQWRGECLAPPECAGYIVPVYCRCQNWNRCAGCGETLYDSRLNAYHYFPPGQKLEYTPGYKVHWHSCPPE